VIEVGEGVVYPVLHALERKKALTSRRRSVNGRSRVYYSVTAAGSLRYAERLGAWSGLAGAVRGLLLGGKHA
jgi:PadR family transcriptional regulator PadR